nr:reverse transcriptase domain-containing protein [Tanacetum cinerariifolium]
MKDVKFVFSDDCVEAFETLKKELTKAPIMVKPNCSLPFELMFDASDYSIFCTFLVSNIDVEFLLEKYPTNEMRLCILFREKISKSRMDDILNQDRNLINNEEAYDNEEVRAGSFSLRKEPIEPLEWKILENRLKPSVDEAPKVKLEALPDHLEYAFLQRDDQLM